MTRPNFEDTAPWHPSPIFPTIKLDPASLYQEDVFTDRRAGTIRRLKPITADGVGRSEPSRPCSRDRRSC